MAEVLTESGTSNSDYGLLRRDAVSICTKRFGATGRLNLDCTFLLWRWRRCNLSAYTSVLHLVIEAINLVLISVTSNTDNNRRSGLYPPFCLSLPSDTEVTGYKPCDKAESYRNVATPQLRAVRDYGLLFEAISSHGGRPVGVHKDSTCWICQYCEQTEDKVLNICITDQLWCVPLLLAPYFHLSIPIFDNVKR